MKKLAALALVLVTLAPALAAQTTYAGKWTGTFAPDGAPAAQTIEMNLTQTGNEIGGTAGPNAERQWKIDKGAVAGTKVTFTVVTDQGLNISFDLTFDKDRLTGTAAAGEGRTAKVDVAKAK